MMHTLCDVDPPVNLGQAPFSGCFQLTASTLGLAPCFSLRRDLDWSTKIENKREKRNQSMRLIAV